MTTPTERLAEARALLAKGMQRFLAPGNLTREQIIAVDEIHRADALVRDALAHDDTTAPTGRGYIPTDVYTSLPQKAKDYIMELETRCDPAGDIAELANRRDQVKQLEALVETARSTLQDVMDAVAWAGWAIDDPRWKVPMRAAHAFPDRKGPDTPAPVEPAKCPDGLLPDGKTCPRCGQPRAPSGIDGGTWVHFPRSHVPAPVDTGEEG